MNENAMCVDFARKHIKFKTNQHHNKDLFRRFIEKVCFGFSDCWYWFGSQDTGGYGVIRDKNLSSTKAHRLSWNLFRGEIPNKMMVLHRCDVRNCVNPDHLFLGTQSDNMKDMTYKGRGITNPQYGVKNYNSKLNDELVKVIRLEYADGEISFKNLGKKYNVSPMTICRVVNLKLWRHI